MTREGLESFAHIPVDKNRRQSQGVDGLREGVRRQGVCPVVQRRPTRKLDCDVELHRGNYIVSP